MKSGPGKWFSGGIRLARPLRGLRRLPVIDPTIADLAGLITGVKPVLYTDVAPGSFRAAEELCSRLGFRYLLPENGDSGPAPHLKGGGRAMMLIGRSAAVLRAAAAAWKENPVGREWGELLGYPSCCVKFYSDWKRGGRGDLVRRAAAATRGRFDFRLNNICNYFSRLSGTKVPYGHAIAGLNARAGTPISILHVASWHSCSYSCPAALGKAREIFSFLSRYTPDLAAWLEDHLSRPVVFFDTFRFLFLEGSPAKAGVSYSAVRPPHSLLGAADRARAARGDRMMPAPRGASVFSGGRRLGAVGAGPRALILDFSGTKGRARENPR